MIRSKNVLIRLVLTLFLVLPYSLLAIYNPASFRLYTSTDEQNLISELSKNELESFSLVDASLIASGAITSQQLEYYFQVFSELAEKIKSELDKSNAAKQARAKKIYELMFFHSMKAYQSDQTTLLEVFDQGFFNCVSSSLLYNLLCEKFGIEARVVVVPAHVYSQVLSGTNWIDVETTSEFGFDPLRTQSGNPEEDRYFIEDLGRNGQKAFLETPRLIALLYYNRGTLAHSQNNYSEAASLLTRGLIIFPEHQESRDNLLGTMLEWAKHESQSDRHRQAVKVLNDLDQILGKQQETARLREALSLGVAQKYAARDDFAAAVKEIELLIDQTQSSTEVAKYQISLRGYLLQWAQHSSKQGNYQAMLSLIDRASSLGEDKFVDSMRLHLITEAAKQISRKQGFPKGYKFFDQQFPKTVENEAIKQNRLHLYGLWINERIDVGQFEEAYLINRELSSLYPANQDVKSNSVWLVQRWMDALTSEATPLRSVPVMLEMYKKYQEPVFLKELVNGTLREADRLQKNRQFEQAENLIQKVQELNLGGEYAHNLKNIRRLVLFNWGVFHAKRDEYIQSIDIGKRALKLYPEDQSIRSNLISFFYNAGLALINTRQYERASQVLGEGLTIFPNDPNLTRLKQHLR